MLNIYVDNNFIAKQVSSSFKIVGVHVTPFFKLEDSLAILYDIVFKGLPSTYFSKEFKFLTLSDKERANTLRTLYPGTEESLIGKAVTRIREDYRVAARFLDDFSEAEVEECGKEGCKRALDNILRYHLGENYLLQFLLNKRLVFDRKEYPVAIVIGVEDLGYIVENDPNHYIITEKKELSTERCIYLSSEEEKQVLEIEQAVYLLKEII